MIRRALLLLLIAGGCTDAPLGADEAKAAATGVVTLSADPHTAQIHYRDVSCKTQRGIRTVELSWIGQIGGQRPLVLIARTRGDDVVDANLFVPPGSFDDGVQGMAQVIAATVDGAPAPDCRLERAADGETLICNNTTIVPWSQAGPIPKPAFKVTFNCPPLP